MAKSDPAFMSKEEMSLDDWVNNVLAPTYDMVYFISSTIRQVMDSINLDRSY